MWRLAGEKCSDRVVQDPRGSVVVGSRRGVLRLSGASGNYFVFVAAELESGARFRRLAS